MAQQSTSSTSLPDLSKLTPKQSEALLKVSERVLAEKDPFSLILDGHLMVKTKQATLIPFKPNKAQRHLLLKIRELWAANKPIRILILKARQMGMSTLVEAIIYAVTAYTENINSLIIANDKDGAGYIFEMSKLFQEKIPQHLRQPEKKSNAQELVFGNIHSQIIIDTSNNLAAGRKYTLRAVHLSEYAFYKDHKILMAGLSQAVPALGRTMIIKETTANGFNFFRDEWQDAKNKKSDYVPMFFPWYWDEDYKMDDTAFELGDAEFEDISKQEFELKAHMAEEGIGDIFKRLAWRRWCIRNNCNGSIETFQQEYPSNDFEAFLASGKCYFDKKVLIKRLSQIEQAEENRSFKSFKTSIVQTANGTELRRNSEGEFTFYAELLEHGHFSESDEFIVAGDASSGSSTDWCVLEVRRKRDNFQVATFRGKVEPPEMARRAMLLGWYFNDAVIAIENDKFGFAANQIIKREYGNIYYQERVDADGSQSNKYGWDTNSVTRPMALSALEEDIRQGALVINNKIFVNECLTFIRNDETKKVEAESGCNDDTVMTMAIASAIRRLHPWKPRASTLPGTPIDERPKNAGFRWKS